MENLAKAMVQAMTEVGSVTATGFNTYDGYKYTTDKDLLKKVQPALVNNGLCILPIGVDCRSTTVNGKNSHLVTVVVTYKLLHESGESLDIQIAGEGADRGDKAIYKAFTGAFKYLLRQTFAIPTGDDVETDDFTEDELRTLIKVKLNSGVAQETISGILAGFGAKRTAELNRANVTKAYVLCVRLEPERGVNREVIDVEED